MNEETISSKELEILRKKAKKFDEQQEYIDLKLAMNGMMEYYHERRREGKIPQCLPLLQAPNKPKFQVESIFYTYIGLLEGRDIECFEILLNQVKSLNKQ